MTEEKFVMYSDGVRALLRKIFNMGVLDCLGEDELTEAEWELLERLDNHVQHAQKT